MIILLMLLTVAHNDTVTISTAEMKNGKVSIFISCEVETTITKRAITKKVSRFNWHKCRPVAKLDTVRWKVDTTICPALYLYYNDKKVKLMNEK